MNRLALLEELVSCESPTSDPQATKACQQLFGRMVRETLGVEGELIEIGGVTHQKWHFGGTPRVLLVGHLDTVWPHGTLARWPFSVSGDVATGPGVFDMKAGVVQALQALTALADLDGITLLLNSDEETGSTTSSQLIIDTARGMRAALVCEPAAGGALKVARKGVGMYGFAVTGRAAHAGLEPERGINAGIALAHALLGITDLGDPAAGTSVTPTVIAAGTTTNTVPAHAQVALDVRAIDPAEFPRVEAGLHAAARNAGVAVPGATVEVTGALNRPPLHPSMSAELFAKAVTAAADLGMPALQGVSVGGGSDGNFTAGAGVPTLDGLGAVGDGAHAEGEHVLVSAMPERAALLARLIEATR
ncbi:MAG: peptidase [Frankiales bacterium]|nr:peptidase [Frankiales bacterium]